MAGTKRSLPSDSDEATSEHVKEVIVGINAIHVPAATKLERHWLIDTIKPGKYLRATANDKQIDSAGLDAEAAGSDNREDLIILDDRDLPTRSQDCIEIAKEGKNSYYVHIAQYMGKEWENSIQTRGAAQGHYCCQDTPHKIFFCGDEMGVGRTLTAVLMMKLAENQPGLSVVVVPKVVCHQWLQEIEQAFTNKESLKAMILTDSRTTAHQLNAMNPDVVIVSFELVETVYRPFVKSLSGEQDRRPTSALHSKFWDLTGHPIKRLFIDEAHRIGNMKSARYRAVKAILAQATALFSGTFPHNRWYGWAGAISFTKAQPFITRRSFNHAFASYDNDGKLLEDPEPSRIRLLQRFLMRFIVARPSSVLRLDANRIHESAAVMENISSSCRGWLAYLDAHPEDAMKSTRIRSVVELFTRLRKQFPDDKICISSGWVKFLDVVKVALRQSVQVEIFDYNGVIPDKTRKANLSAFQNSKNTNVVLLLSGKAGGEGLNIPQASIIIQTEIWWNRNSELQLCSRFNRPGLKRKVKVIRMVAENSQVEAWIRKTQINKTTINTALMRPLVRLHTEAPGIPEIVQVEKNLQTLDTLD